MKTGKIFKNNEPKTVENTNVVPFQVIEGGKAKPAGKEPPSEDWLTNMTPNTIFLAIPKHYANFDLLDYKVTGHSENAVQLELIGAEKKFWVKAGRFCSAMELVDIIQRGYE